MIQKILIVLLIIFSPFVLYSIFIALMMVLTSNNKPEYKSILKSLLKKK